MKIIKMKRELILKHACVVLPSCIHLISACVSSHVIYLCIPNITIYMYLNHRQYATTNIFMIAHYVLLLYSSFENVCVIFLSNAMNILDYMCKLYFEQTDLITYIGISYCINICNISIILYAGKSDMYYMYYMYYTPYLCSCVLKVYYYFEDVWFLLLCSVILRHKYIES